MLSPAQNLRPNDALKALRPHVPTEATDAEGSVGAFLHATLRPVLKLQNDLLLAVVADFVCDHHIALRPTDQHHQLTELLTRNTKLRYTVAGLISGQFTTDEYAYYRQHRSELNRRLLEMTLRRVLDQADSVAALAA
ncbi:hypothetical protein [Hymenobacter properus]|uniref:Glyoxalase n=1 Tax=Hymenobacter properus TaxID=2791026 RepID=A0A931FL72_9BACT|nr:hypothetical protein [Hymenobacter properus]MBF9142530.1 hypothetical protein [Hymenobacter properus]MBR7721337.1 hypothetical protein [Microvirga sp. SRT04]